MNAKIHELYVLFLIQDAKVLRFTEYDAYYELELEWEELEAIGLHSLSPGIDLVVRHKLFAFEKIRR